MSDILSRLSNSLCIPTEVAAFIRYFPTGKLYITGSQWLGVATPFSDWDFFLQSSTDNIERLRQQKFCMASTNCYNDPSVISVWQNPSWYVTKIHVQVVRNARLKNQIQEVIRPNLLLAHDSGYSKEVIRQIWAVAFRVAHDFLK